MLRKLYYALPVKLRYLARRIYHYPSDLFKNRSSLVPPTGLIYTGGGDFEKQGQDWLNFFKQHAELSENNNFLDIGSGIGRIAIPLVRYLKGEYHGFDPVQQGVDWCNKKIASQHSNFHFLFVDLFNDLYKNKGIDASSYQFAYPKNHFNVSCAISVFTHMLPDEVANYLKQTRMVLKNEGYLVATFFILDDESKALMHQNKGLDFKFSFGDYATIDKQVLSANVAYEKDFLYKMIENEGLSIEKEFKGFWCGRAKATSIDFQDILVLKKREQ
jgi:cyclopropane fatty-acyl-phospholipid synthase-like methyltransferase